MKHLRSKFSYQPFVADEGGNEIKYDKSTNSSKIEAD